MGPGRYPQYTRADFGPEAVGRSNHKHITSPNVQPYGMVKSRMVAEPWVKPLSRSCAEKLSDVTVEECGDTDEAEQLIGCPGSGSIDPPEQDGGVRFHCTQEGIRDSHCGKHL